MRRPLRTLLLVLLLIAPLSRAAARPRLGSLRGSLRAVAQRLRLIRRGKVAYMTGTFDPIHDGHLLVAKKALKELGVDKVVMIPNPFPQNKNPLPVGVRARMARHAVKKLPGIEIASDALIETYKRGGFDALSAALGKQHRGALLYRISGADSFVSGLQFYQGKRRALRDFLTGRRTAVVPRPGYQMPDKLPAGVSALSPSELTFSSTKVRRTLEQGKRPEGVHPDVYRMIKKIGAYGHGGAAQK